MPKKTTKKEPTWDEIGKLIGKKIEKEEGNCRPWKPKVKHVHEGCGGALYFFGFIGAAVYYIQAATSFWMGVWGFIKALVWPAFLVYGVLRYLGM